MRSQAFTFEDYQMEETIGPGACGTFFRGFRPSENAGRGRRDLLYRASPEVAQDVNTLELIRDQLARSTGISHANLFSPVHSFSSADELILVSEWIPSVRLSVLTGKMAESGVRWPVPVAIYLVGEIAKALCHLHCSGGFGFPQGLVHGQVCPENIFITFDGHVKILSLGMAAAESASLRYRQGHREGLANFASPEQAAGQECDGRSDLFSLGTLMWGLIAGRPLFPASSRDEWVRMLNEETPLLITQNNSEAPLEIDKISDQLLNRDRHLRYPLGEKAAQDLAAVLSFRFPEFKSSEFASFCINQTAPFRAAYQSYLDQRDNSLMQTKELDLNANAAPEEPTVSSGAAAPKTTIEIDRASTLKPVEVPRPNIMVASSDSSSIGQSIPMVAIVAFCVAIAAVGGAWGLNHHRLHTLHRNGGLKSSASGQLGFLYLITPETDYELLVNGKAVLIDAGTARVPANQELEITVKKDGYEDFETSTMILPGEELELPVTFKKSPQPY